MADSLGPTEYSDTMCMPWCCHIWCSILIWTLNIWTRWNSCGKSMPIEWMTKIFLTLIELCTLNTWTQDII